MAQLLLAHVDLVVHDMARAVEFYQHRLGFELIEDAVVEGELPRYLSGGRSETMRLVLLRCSRIGAAVELLELSGLASANREPPAFRGNVSFVVDDLMGIMARLEGMDVLPLSPRFRVTLPQAGATDIVLYRDPDGHVLELIQRPAPRRPG